MLLLSKKCWMPRIDIECFWAGFEKFRRLERFGEYVVLSFRRNVCVLTVPLTSISKMHRFIVSVISKLTSAAAATSGATGVLVFRMMERRCEVVGEEPFVPDNDPKLEEDGVSPSMESRAKLSLNHS